MPAKFLAPLFSVIVAGIWLAVVFWVHSEVGGAGTGALFAILAWLVGTPGVLAVGAVCSAWLGITAFFIVDNDETKGVTSHAGFLAWCFFCWAASMFLGVVWPIVVVLKGVAQMATA